MASGIPDGAQPKVRNVLHSHLANLEAGNLSEKLRIAARRSVG